MASSLPAAALTEKTALTPSDTAFYTFGLTTTARSLALVIAYRAYRWVSYAMFTLLILATVASMDGTLYAILGGGDYLLWVVPFLTYCAISACGFWVAATNIDAGHHLSRVRPGLLLAALASTILALSSVVWLGHFPLSLMWAPANILFLGMLFSQCLPPLTWSGLEPRLTRVTRIFPVLLAFYYISILFITFTREGLEQATLNILNRIGFVLYASFAMTVVIGRAFSSAKRQEDSEREALLLARREAELQASLLEAERNYQRIRSVARTFIDLDSSGNVVTQKSSLAARENLATSVFAQSLRQMFKDDATASAKVLRIHNGACTVSVNPLLTMRIMNNLVGNAIAHPRASRIVSGFRPRAGQVVFQVHHNGADTSPQASERLKGSAGHEIALVETLCQQQGLVFEHRSQAGQGSSATLYLPAATLEHAR